MDDDLFANDPGSREIERRLRAYGDERLSPSAAATTRMRAAVMTVADRRAALIAAEATLSARVSPPIASAPRRIAWRRPALALFAGVLSLGLLAGTVFAARPGGPLYDARIWAEMATLPSDVLARAEAEVERLEARLQEAQQASAAGDGAGVEAALEAYASIVEEAALGSQGDPAALARIETGVTNHVSVLTGLADRVPAPAQAAIQHALSSSSKVLDGIDQKPPKGTDSGTPGGPAATPAGKPDKPTPDPVETQKPAKTAPPEKSGPPGGPPGNPGPPVSSGRP
jgi:hypothetical protein